MARNSRFFRPITGVPAFQQYYTAAPSSLQREESHGGIFVYKYLDLEKIIFFLNLQLYLRYDVQEEFTMRINIRRIHKRKKYFGFVLLERAGRAYK